MRYSSPNLSKLARADISCQFQKTRYLCRHCLQNEWTLLTITSYIILSYSHREGEAKSVLDIIDLQNDYVLDLHKDAEHEFKNFFGYRNLMKKWIDDKVNKNLFTFRNQTFKSVVTGTQSTSNRTPFMENFDDSMEGIMNQC